MNPDKGGMVKIRKLEQELDIPVNLRMDIQECEKSPKYPTIAVDFDGVIHKYSKGWQDGEIYDKPIEGAIEAYYELIRRYNVVIFTARDDTKAVKNWMEKNFDFEKNLGAFYEPNVTNVKPQAVAYIDDRGIRFTDWPSTLNELNIIDNNPEETAKKAAMLKRIQKYKEWFFVLCSFFAFSYFGWLMRGIL